MANPVNWFEIPTKDLARAKVFYEKVFDCKMKLGEMGPMKMAFFPMEKDAPGAGGTLMYSGSYEPSSKGTLVYFSVNDIEETLARIKNLDGKVLLSKMSIGEYGFIAHFEDSEGNRVALHSMR